MLDLLAIFAVCVAVGLLGFFSAYTMSKGRFPWPQSKGCCPTCRGTGVGGGPETNGMCPDCYATGHAHPGKCAPWWRRGR